MVIFCDPTTKSSEFSQIPFTRQEAAAIQMRMRSVKPDCFFGSDRAADLILRSQTAQIIHYASHVVRKAPNVFGILINQEEGDLPVVITSEEIGKMKMDADLVVLNLCESARGALLIEEGIGNFPKAFLDAGARRVIATLWRIDDLSSMQLMDYFYTELVKQPEADAKSALRSAQLQLSQNPAWVLPQYWAAHQLIGDPSAFSLAMGP
jgi:CHAT domain-containing protein